MRIRIGCRASRLAIIQAENTIKKIQEKYKDAFFDVIKITTSGDKIQDRPLYDLGGKALFIKELESALMQNDIDIAVHSMKDIPAKFHDDLKIGCIVEREDPVEVLVCDVAKSIENLPKNAVVGTSSMRRISQIKNIRNDINFVPLRGNVPTIIEAVLSKKIDATILAFAGITRLSMNNKSYINKIDVNSIIPAVGQGAIACQIRKNDGVMHDICNSINNFEMYNLVSSERGFLEYLDADCKTPMAASASYVNGRIFCRYFLSDINFTKSESLDFTFDAKDAYENGLNAGRILSDRIKHYK